MGELSMDETDNNVYHELHDEDTTVSACSALFSCLYAYTIGSCLYFNVDDADREEIELKPMISSDQKNDKRNLEEGGNTNTGWEKEECRMKKRIQYHFMDHIRRWMDSDQRRFPWKMILHLLLVALVTTQVTYLPDIRHDSESARAQGSSRRGLSQKLILISCSYSYCQLIIVYFVNKNHVLEWNQRILSLNENLADTLSTL